MTSIRKPQSERHCRFHRVGLSLPTAAAYHGLAGEIVQAIAPHTEADPVAVLVQLLVAYGALIGGGAWFKVEADAPLPQRVRRSCRRFAVSRKGSALGHVKQLLGEVEEDFPLRVEKGLSSGEGVVWLLRDPEGKDAGAPDRRLLVTEPEFARVLSGREIASLSPVLREAWDGEDLETLTRNSPLRATEAHLALIGHITADGVASLLDHAQHREWFAQSFPFRARVAAHSCCPTAGMKYPLAKTGLKERLAQALEHARGAGELRFHPRAKKHWTTSYEEMSERPMDGLTGALTARAEAHSLRSGVDLRAAGRCELDPD